MPSMLDMIKASAVPANLMSAAANGSLAMPAVETLEVLVYLTHNKVFGEKAKLTLASWDLEATQAAVRDPSTPHEILDYFISPKNIRSKLLPGLLENPAVHDDVLILLAAEGSRDVVRAMLGSARIRESQKILHTLCLNVHLEVLETEQVKKWLSGLELHLVPGLEPQTPSEEDTPEAADALKAFELEHAAEFAAVVEAPFRPMGGTYGLEFGESEHQTEGQMEGAAIVEAPQEVPIVTSPAAAMPAVAAHASGGAAAAPAKKKPQPSVQERVSVLQKISRLDVKGRVNLAVRGTKEERAILIRDGTKLVSLAVLQSPKISDGEVEKFAAQKNVLEATLRGITMHRRFMKNYSIIRNLTGNPRTPLDLSLTLVKNLLTQDLKNLSGNKEVSETLRKMAYRALKQKTVAPK